MKPFTRVDRAAPASPAPENYLASVSDLMVGLLFVFIIMLMTFALNYRVAQVRSVQAISQIDAAYEARNRVLKAIQGALKDRGIAIEIDLENGLIRLPEALLFDPGKAEFRPGGSAAVRTVAIELSRFLPQCAALEAVLVEGHTDNTPIHGVLSDRYGTYHDNWDLSFQRAKRTYGTVIERVPALGRLENTHHKSLLSMSAYGPSRPVGDNALAAGRRLNRRIDVRLIIETPRQLTLAPAPPAAAASSGALR